MLIFLVLTGISRYNIHPEASLWCGYYTDIAEDDGNILLYDTL
jgi:hypothetical protein